MAAAQITHRSVASHAAQTAKALLSCMSRSEAIDDEYQKLLDDLSVLFDRRVITSSKANCALIYITRVREILTAVKTLNKEEGCGKMLDAFLSSPAGLESGRKNLSAVQVWMWDETEQTATARISGHAASRCLGFPVSKEYTKAVQHGESTQNVSMPLN